MQGRTSDWWLAAWVGGMALLAVGLVWLRLRRGAAWLGGPGVEPIRRDGDPQAGWERRHEGTILVVVAFMFLAGLAWVAFPPAKVDVGEMPPLVHDANRGLVAMILWLLLAGLATVGIVNAAVRLRLVGFPGPAALLALGVLAALAILAAGYFWLLEIDLPPAPTTHRWWKKAFWGTLILIAAGRWWRRLAIEARRPDGG